MLMRANLYNVQRLLARLHISWEVWIIKKMFKKEACREAALWQGREFPLLRQQQSCCPLLLRMPLAREL